MISTNFISEQKKELEYKTAEVEMIKSQLTLLDIKIDRYDTIIQNIDKKIIPLVDEINVAISSVKTAYDNRISAGCKSDLHWELVGQKKYGFFGDYYEELVYQCKKNPNVRIDYGYYGAKYYRRPQNQDYCSNIVREFLGTISLGSTVLAVIEDAGTSNLKIDDQIIDNIDTPTVFSSSNLPTIVGFGTTAIIGFPKKFGGSITYGSTILNHTGIGSTGDVNVGDSISLPNILNPNTSVLGIGVSSEIRTVFDPNYGGPGVGSFITTSVSIDSLILSIPAISTGSGIFNVGGLVTYPSIILSDPAIKDAENTYFTDIRTTQSTTTTFDYSNNPVDPVTIGIINSNNVGLGHKLVRVNNGSPSGPFQWHEVMTSGFSEKPYSQLNSDEKYLISKYAEPSCGADRATYYFGNNSWPVKLNYSCSSIEGQSVCSVTSTEYAQEGDVVIVGSGSTEPNGIGTVSVSSLNPSVGVCSSLTSIVINAEAIRDQIISKNVPIIDSLINSAKPLREMRNSLESRAFGLLQGKFYAEVEINKLRNNIKELENNDYTDYEPPVYYFDPKTGKLTSC